MEGYMSARMADERNDGYIDGWMSGHKQRPGWVAGGLSTYRCRDRSTPGG